MKKATLLQTLLARLFQIGLALIPAFEGILGLLNDLEGAKSTLASVIVPLLSMQTVQPEFVHSWRGIHNPALQEMAYYFLASLEGVIGLLAIISIVGMIKNFRQDDVHFLHSQAWARGACMFGILIWGFGFFVIGGDFFLAWQSSSLGYFQGGGLNYALMMFIPYTLLKKYEHSRTI
ncbi:MAG: DUF2165 family protein [Pseudomonadota bacterium]